jgi:hypothetical protein
MFALASLNLAPVGFAAPAMRAMAPSRAVNVVMSDDLSAAIPFVKKPKNLNGELLLDIGFDPLGFTSGVDMEQIENFRVAELKHGRVCMLAVTGFLTQELLAPYQAPPFNEPNAINAFAVAPFLGIPGDIGFDPLGLSKNGIKQEWAEAEIKHGRLAMIAFLAFQIQTNLSGQPVIALTFDIFSP